VNAYERVVSWLTERLEGVEPSYRRDVALTTREVTADAGWLARSIELISLVGLALRLRSRSRTGNRADQIWRQGVYLGSIGLLVASTGAAWANAVDPGRDAGALLAASTFASAATLAASVACGLRGHRNAAVLLSITGTVAFIGSGAAGAEAGAFATACIVSLGGLLAGTAPPASGRSTVLAVSLLPLAALPLALVGGADATAVAATFTAVGAVALLALGWFDPRLAAAATTLVFSRLLASGFDELGQALTVLAEDGQQALLLRWMVMAVGVVAAWLATQRSIRRLVGL
jgi:hypothetical protein